jgi:outer membrane protein TolC
LILAAFLATVAGCVGENAPRHIETSYSAPEDATKPVSGAKPTTEAPPSTTSRAGAMNFPNAGASSRPAPAAQATTRTAHAVHGNQDPSVKPAASDGSTPPPSPLVMPQPAATYPIDLATALRLADLSNPTIAAARTMILEALALQLTARTLLVPSLNSGVSYHGHDGLLQKSSGKMIDVSLQSLYVGSGALTVTAGTFTIPGVNIFSQLTDAWFEPLAARQRVAGARFGAAATSLNILMDVAVLHIELLGNQSILDLQRLSESQFHEIYRITNDYAETGQGREADAHRALAQWRRRQALVQKAEEELAVVAARLANRLNLDPAVRLEPIGGPLVPLNLVALETPQPELIQVALRQRPDIAARTAAIAEAEAHCKQEIGRPLLPTVWLGFSGGVFGGGSNLVPPLVGNFAGRTDFDVRVYWTLLNLGAGNLALVKERHAEVSQAIATRARTINRARDEVSTALAAAKAAQNQIELARRELASAELGYDADLERTLFRGAARPRDVLPIEVLNSLNLLAEARVNLVRAMVLFDQSQFRLWVALGSPPPLMSD